ncbi:MAG: ABC transporter ATP-binding protein [Hydrogenoanaerobacterium sp.]
MGKLVDIRDIYKIYIPGENEVHALDGVSLSIEHGEFIAIVGHSGSGKSTLMNVLGCLDVPSEGSYFLDGEDVSKLSDDELSDIRNKEIGFVFQGFNLIPSLDAVENVELPLIYRGLAKDERRKLAVEALERVGLGERLSHRPMQMSGGQQQRVAIARAIAAKPPIILADEPTGNLDTKSGKDVMRILNELWCEGRTIILITHDNEIAHTARRIVKILDGKIVSDVINEAITKSEVQVAEA